MSQTPKNYRSYNQSLMLIYGWIRNTLFETPIVIYHIINMFFYNDFYWDSYDNINLQSFDNNTIQSIIGDSNYCKSNNLLSKNIYNFVKWEITIDHFDGFWFYGSFGYIEYPYHNYGGQFTVELWMNNWRVNSINNYKLIPLTNVNHQDKFKIYFNFQKNKSSFYVNDKPMGIIDSNMPSQLIPIIILSNNQKVTTTKWELTYKRSMG